MSWWRIFIELLSWLSFGIVIITSCYGIFNLFYVCLQKWKFKKIVLWDPVLCFFFGVFWLFLVIWSVIVFLILFVYPQAYSWDENVAETLILQVKVVFIFLLLEFIFWVFYGFLESYLVLIVVSENRYLGLGLRKIKKYRWKKFRLARDYETFKAQQKEILVSERIGLE